MYGIRQDSIKYNTGIEKTVIIRKIIYRDSKNE